MSASEKKKGGGISKAIITPTTTYKKMIFSGCEYPHRLLVRYPISIIISPSSDCEVLLFTWDPHDQINFNPTPFKSLHQLRLFKIMIENVI